jgi:hypothetical protein
MTGMEPATVAMLVSAAGTAASMQAQQEAADERSSIINRSLMQTDVAGDKASRLVAEEAQNYNPADRETALNQQQEATFQQGQKDMGGATLEIDGAGDDGNVSSDYLSAKAERALSEGQRMTAIARELAKTRAPGQLQANEGIRRAGLAGDLSSMWSGARAGANAAGMDAEGVAAPWYGNVGQIAGAAASGYGSGQPAGGQAANGANYSLTDASLGDNGAASSWWSSGNGRVKLGRSGG